MKNILLNSCYPPPLSAAKEAPSSVSSLSQLVPRHVLQRTESPRAPGQPRPGGGHGAAAAPPVPSRCSGEPPACPAPCRRRRGLASSRR